MNAFCLRQLANNWNTRPASLVVATALFLVGSIAAHAQEQRPANRAGEINALQSVCQGRCAATIFAGRQLNTGLADVGGVGHTRLLTLDLRSLVPPWRYSYGDSYFVGGALSYSLLDFSRIAAIEVEGGLGSRFRSLHEGETWIALYARWNYFPWRDHLLTSIAVSTGLNYASAVTPYELSEAVAGKGSRLLHYFSPEVTFALPSRPDTELVIRIHHRSGGGHYFAGDFPLYGSLFRGAGGGMQYLCFGLRYRF